MTLDLEKFDHKIAEVANIAKQASEVDVSNLDDVKDIKKVLADNRIEITKAGKAMRKEANDIKNVVLEKEKSLLDMIVPHEEKMKEVIAVAKEKEAREVRKEFIPARRAELDAMGIEATDEELIAMDETAYGAFKLEKLEEIGQKKKEEEEKVEQEKQREQMQKDAEAKAKSDLDARLEKEKEEKIQQAKEDMENVKKDAAFQKFLKENEYDKNTDILQKSSNGEIKIYRLINTYKS